MKILLTGSNGYIGSVMAPIFEGAGHQVVGLDIGYFADCRFLPTEEERPFIRKDVRDLERADLEGFNAVVHLAALSNDPIGNLRADWTREINLEGTVRLAELARAAGVERFLFSSSCIMYGSAQALEVNEEAPLAPATEYARSKVLAEEALRTLAAPGFSPVYIRNGTVYGVSPRMRFDTVLNDFVGQAVTSGKVVVFSNGEPWRPVVHVEDVSRTFLLYLEAPTDVIHNQAFNNGAASLNYRVRELAEIVVRTVPGATLEIRGEAGADQRTYKANFDKFARTFPSFKFKWNAENGARELYESLKNLGVDTAIFRSDRFTRLKWLDHLLKSQTLDDNLRWRTSAEAII